MFLKFRLSKRIETERYKYSPVECNSASVCNSRGWVISNCKLVTKDDQVKQSNRNTCI